MAFHPLGTARMAARPADGVLDQSGQVHGIDRLYVCDGSALPTSLGVNPQLTIMALATRLADHLLHDH
jgi:choline dehydrogenase-like flavoprotein